MEYLLKKDQNVITNIKPSINKIKGIFIDLTTNSKILSTYK